MPILIFLGYFFLEVVVSVNIASSIGGIATFFEIILSAMLGMYLLRNLPLLAIPFLERNLSIGNFAINTTIASFLLIVPGFLSDIIGLMLILIGVISSFINKKYTNTSTKNTTYVEDEIIDVEVIEP